MNFGLHNNTIRSECLNLWYSKSFHPSVMKFTAFTKPACEISKQSEHLPIHYNFILD